MRLGPILCVLTLVATASPVAANGRFPAATNVRFDQNSDSALFLPVTFGLLISADSGTTFHWICEDAVGYGGTFDPDYAVGASGSLYATTFTGLRKSTDGGCSFETVTLGNLPNDTWAEEVTVAPDNSVWVTTATTAKMNDVLVDRNDGNGFVGTGLETATGWWKSVEAAPSSSNRLYVTGYDVSGGPTPVVHLRRTDDAGTGWVTLDTGDFTFGSEPQLFIEAISPTDPDTVFARVPGVGAPTGDALYRSTDAGENWSLVLETQDAITSVVARRDGQTVVVATINDGIYTSSTGGAAASYTKLPNPPRAACMGEGNDSQLYSCGSNWEPDNFALGRSTDGTTWTPVHRFQDIAGPLSCPAGTTQAEVCVLQRWPGVCQQLGICGDAPDAGPGSNDAGTGGGGGGGCGCRAGGPDHSSRSVLVLLFASAVLLLRRRRG